MIESPGYLAKGRNGTPLADALSRADIVPFHQTDVT